MEPMSERMAKQPVRFFRTLRISMLFWLLLSEGFAQGQAPYGNEWIDPVLTYVRLSVGATGWYRLTGEKIQSTGADLPNIEPGALRLFYRGKEVPIRVSSSSAARLMPDDFIEFYGLRNDGTADTDLYVSPEAQPHPYYSLYSDSSAYFLTWKKTGPDPKRILTEAGADQHEPLGRHLEEELRLLTSQYPAGNIYPLGAGYDNGTILTTYDTGEGWTGIQRYTGQWETQTIRFERPFLPDTSLFTFEILLAGRSPGPHKAEIWSGKPDALLRIIGEISWEDYGTARFGSTFSGTELHAQEVSVSIRPILPGESVSLSYIRYRYPQEIHFSGAQKHYRTLSPGLLEPGLPAGTALFDVTDPDAVRQILPVRQNVFAVAGNRTLCAVNTPYFITDAQLTTFPDIVPDQVDYLIITHPRLRRLPSDGTDPVADYAAYRASGEGGNYRVLVLHIREIFDRFNYGLPGPLGIQRAAAWLHTHGNLKFLFLIGKSIDPQTARHLPDAASVDMIPNAGWPGSDIPLTMKAGAPLSDPPLVPVGRLNTADPADVRNYLDKVKLHESAPASAPWRKNVLHLSGGRTPGEITTFRNYMEGFERKWTGNRVAAAVRTLSKQTTDPVEQFPIAPLVNDGISMLTLFGHSSLDITDIDIGKASDPSRGYRNTGRYPVVLVNGCALGNIYYGPLTLSNDWILAPGKGAVAFIAHTYNGLISEMKTYTDYFYEVVADGSFTGRPVGAIQQETIRRYLGKSTSVFSVATAQQMNLQGDPAVMIFPAARPDYAWIPESLQLTDKYGDPLQPGSDSVRISLTAANYGRHMTGNFRVSFVRNAGDHTRLETGTDVMAFPLRDTLYWLVPHQKEILEAETWEFTIDPDHVTEEEDKSNNQLVYAPAITYPELPDVTPPLLDVRLDGRRLFNGEAVSPRPEIQVLVTDENAAQARTDTTGISLYIRQKCTGCSFSRISLREAAWDADGGFRLTVKLPAPLARGEYTLRAEAEDLSGNRAPAYLIDFRVSDTFRVNTIQVAPNPASYLVRFSMELEGPAPPQLWTVHISDLLGRVVTSMTHKPHLGINELFWRPAGLPAGLYLYRMELKDGGNNALLPHRREHVSGKIIWKPD